MGRVRDQGSLFWPELPRALLTAVSEMSISPLPPAAASQPLQKAKAPPFCLSRARRCLLWGARSMMAKKAAWNREARVKSVAWRDPHRPPISRGLQIRRPRKCCVCSFANIDGFIHHPPTSLAPALLLLFIPAQRDSAKRFSHLFCTEAWGGEG